MARQAAGVYNGNEGKATMEAAPINIDDLLFARPRHEVRVGQLADGVVGAVLDVRGFVRVYHAVDGCAAPVRDLGRYKLKLNEIKII